MVCLWRSRPVRAALIAVLVSGSAIRAQEPEVVSFDDVRSGALPPGFRTLASADAEPGRWAVERVDGTVALAQLAESRAGYRLAVLESPLLEHLRAGVRVHMGAGDRAAGLAWRVRDGGNYYAARLDLASDEFILYKFVRGNRIALSNLSGLRLDETLWHELTVEHRGDRIRVWLNGIPVASEHDSSLSSPGMLGPWLPSDSTARFSHLWYDPIGRN